MAVAKILLNMAPILLMIGLIPLITEDYLLSLIYVVVIASALAIHYERGELRVFLLGFVIMMFFETVFIATGVETFVRTSLFGIMPLWLPLLWGYGFIAIKRCVRFIQ